MANLLMLRWSGSRFFKVKKTDRRQFGSYASVSEVQLDDEGDSLKMGDYSNSDNS